MAACDVFISFKKSDSHKGLNEDTRLAKKIYDYLTEKGLCVFYCDESLEQQGVDDYQKAIDDALDSARVLVAVGTSKKNLSSEWVRYEYHSFINDVLSGGKSGGRVFCYLAGMEEKDLPRALRRYEAIVDGPGSLEKLYRFIANCPLSAVGPSTGRSAPVETQARTPAVRKVLLAVGATVVVLVAIGIYAVRSFHTKPVATPPPSATEAKVADREIDELVKDLARRYRENRFPQKLRSDDWSTKPLSVAVLGIEMDVDAFKMKRFVTMLNGALQNTTGVTVVERDLLDRLLSELKLSSSDLADPLTSLKLGKILSAGLIVSGTVSPEDHGQTATLRLIDTETSEIKKVITVHTSEKEPGPAMCQELARRIGEWNRTERPIRGRVLSVEGKRCRVNLGTRHGLKKGARLELIAGSGKKMGPAVAGVLEAIEVDNETSVLVMLEGNTPPHPGDRLQVKM